MPWTTRTPTKAGKYWFEDADGDQLLIVLDAYHGVLCVDQVYTARRLWKKTFYLGDNPQSLVGRWWSEPLQEPPWAAGGVTQV